RSGNKNTGNWFGDAPSARRGDTHYSCSMARTKKKRKMTAATLSRLPLAAGGSLVGSLGRGGFWAFSRLLDFGFWGSAQFMRAPIAVSSVAAILGFSILAGSNALYFQRERHPAPLFFSAPKAATLH